MMIDGAAHGTSYVVAYRVTAAGFQTGDHVLIGPGAGPDRRTADICRIAAGADPRDIVVFWDTQHGPVPIDLLEAFERSSDDVWHAGRPTAHGGEHWDLLWAAFPGEPYAQLIPADLDFGLNFRVNLAAAFVRAHVFLRAGGPLAGFQSDEGTDLELGYRWFRCAVIARQRMALAAVVREVRRPPPLSDQYRLLALHCTRSVRRQALMIRLLSLANPIRELSAWRRGAVREQDRPVIEPPARDLAAVAVPSPVQVDVVLPTRGRYRYLGEVLSDIRNQTVRPSRIFIADGNAPEDREPAFYEQFQDLPLTVFWLEPGEQGVSKSRNRCLVEVRGTHVWFVDDDSRFDARNLEHHLRLLSAYNVDVSVGPAYTTDRPDLHPFQQAVAFSFMDCGTTLCTTESLSRVGGFDGQYDAWMQGEDADLGDRLIASGAILLNNPVARRFHYLAPVGGTRISRVANHRWTRWSFLPRPAPTVWYRMRRNFGRTTAITVTLMSWITIGFRSSPGLSKPRRLNSPYLHELFALPLSCVRLVRSLSSARKMIAGGARIPDLPLWGRDTSIRREACAEEACTSSNERRVCDVGERPASEDVTT